MILALTSPGFSVLHPPRIFVHTKKDISSAVFFNWLWLTPERATGRCTLEVTQLLKKLQLLLYNAPELFLEREESF
jgi:hypothetical protein